MPILAPTPIGQTTTDPAQMAANRANTVANSGGLLQESGGKVTSSSPTVITDANIHENTIPNVIAKAGTYTNPQAPTPGGVGGTGPGTSNTNGTSLDTSGMDTSNMSYEDILNNQLGIQNGKPLDPVIQQELSLIQGQSSNQDAVTQASIAAIQNQYNARYADTVAEQKASTAGLEQTLNLGGSSRYAPVSSSGILSSKESYDLKTLNDLSSTEQSQIAQLRQAQADKNYKAMSDQLAILDKTRSDKIALATKIADNMAEVNKEKRDQKFQIDTQNKKDVTSAATLAAQHGAPKSVIDAINNAKTGVEAISAAGGFLKDSQYDFQKVTDAFGNDKIIAVNKLNPKESYTVGGGDGKDGTSLSTILNGTPSAKEDTTNPTTGLSFAQYGLLANTDFKPANQTDQLAQSYLDKYLKTGVVPTASTMGRGLKPGAFAAVDSRARDLYFKATGTPMPNPEVIKGYQNILQSNNQMANNLKIQEQTVKANVDFSLDNMKKNGLNSAGFKPLDSVINTVQNMFDDPHVGQLIAQNQTIQNELGSLLAVKNASGTTVYDKLTSAGIITSSDSSDQIQTKVNALISEASNFAGSLNSANADIYKQIDPLMQDPNNPLRASEMRTGTQKLTDYYNNNPDKRDGMTKVLDDFKTKYGRDMNDSEILQVFPEVESSIMSVKNK